MRTQTNFTGFRRVIEDAGELPAAPIWMNTEVNAEAITANATISTVARNPISPDRQARKGVVTNLESSFSFTTDLTMDAVQEFVPAFLLVRGENDDLIWGGGRGSLNVGNTASYSVGNLSTDQRRKLHYSNDGNKSLLFARGFSRSANNGLKVLSNAATSDLLNVGTGNLEIEPVTPRREAFVEVAGIRGGSGDLSFVVSADRTAVLDTSDTTADVDDWGLVPGRWIIIGGIADANCFQGPTGNNAVVRGFARVVSIDTSDGILLDNVTESIPTGTMRGSGREVDILFGRFWRNVPVGDPLFLRRTFRFEVGHPELGDGVIGADGEILYSYSIGNTPNNMTLNISPAQLITASFDFVGKDTTPSAPAPSNRVSDSLTPLLNEGFNATSDIVSIRFSDGENAITSDFTSFSLTISNNITVENVIGTLGARYTNTGNLAVSANAEGVLNSALLSRAIRNNTTMSMSLILQNPDGGVVIDFPSVTAGGGGKTFSENQSVRINTTLSAVKDRRFNTSVSFSHFPVLPAIEA